ncbi:MAG: GGDEF domain-containing protein [Sedimenticola thiotaurini]|uniref:GGDEF domain-containing protein n=1 Tax=Sedimenticola thiotaurini TaxID=1543721 RepID=A0A558CSA1_9GAMM|nr:MAG: GGDEF domain-containing protein [Sedimenticola thiotaurini]
MLSLHCCIIYFVSSIEIASRLKASLREIDSATRMGGDEFLLLVSEIESRTHIETMADRILEQVRVPFKLGPETLFPSCSMGIALSTEGATSNALIANSDRALYLAKKQGKNRYAFANASDKGVKYDPIE